MIPQIYTLWSESGTFITVALRVVGVVMMETTDADDTIEIQNNEDAFDGIRAGEISQNDEITVEYVDNSGEGQTETGVITDVKTRSAGDTIGSGKWSYEADQDSFTVEYDVEGKNTHTIHAPVDDTSVPTLRTEVDHQACRGDRTTSREIGDVIGFEVTQGERCCADGCDNALPAGRTGGTCSSGCALQVRQTDDSDDTNPDSVGIEDLPDDVPDLIASTVAAALDLALGDGEITPAVTLVEASTIANPTLDYENLAEIARDMGLNVDAMNDTGLGLADSAEDVAREPDAVREIFCTECDGMVNADVWKGTIAGQRAKDVECHHCGGEGGRTEFGFDTVYSGIWPDPETRDERLRELNDAGVHPQVSER